MKIPQIGVPEGRTVTSGSPPFSLPVSNPMINIHTNDGLWNDMNRGISEAAGVAKEFGAKLERAQDQSDIADAENKARLSIGNYMTGLQNNSDYKSYTPGLLKLQQNLSSDENFKTLRPEVQGVIKNSYNNMFTEAQIHVNQFARNEQIGQMKTKALTRYDQNINAGNFAGAEQEIRDAVQFQYLSQAEGDKRIAEIAPLVTKAQVKNEISFDPAKASTMLEAVNADGSYTHFRDLKEDDRIRYQHFAGKILEQKQTEFKLAAVEAIKSQAYHGQLSLSQLEDAHAKKIINADTYKSLLNDVADPNRTIEFNAGTYNKMKQAEIKFLNSPQADADYNNYLTSFAELNTQLPKEYRGHFAKVLEGFGKPDNEKITNKNVYKVGAGIIKTAWENNEFWIDPAGLGNKVSDTDGTQQAVGYATAMDEFDDYMKMNPGASPEEGIKYAKGLVKAQQENKLKTGFTKSYMVILQDERMKQQDLLNKLTGNSADVISNDAPAVKNAMSKSDTVEIPDPKMGKVAIFNKQTKEFIEWKK